MSALGFILKWSSLQIVAVSSAAVAFSSMSEISPCLLAYWRTQFTAIILLPAGVYSIWKMTAGKSHALLIERASKQRQFHLCEYIAIKGYFKL